MKKRVFSLFLTILILLSSYYSISADTIQPINIINPYKPITYSQMSEYIYALENHFDELIDVEVIGKSLDQRDIILVKLGKGNTLVHINGSMHARERITTNIILKNIEDYCNAYMQNNTLSGYNVKNLLDHVTIYYVPMVNPDGVDYTILGKESIKDPLLKSNIDSIYRSPQAGWNHVPNNWKSNIRGIDLNRQWYSDWNKELKYDPGKPANAMYKGATPLSEPEVQAIYQLTIDNPFMIHVAYHTQGKIFYWYKNQKENFLNHSVSISKKIANLTGFRPSPKLNYNDYFDTSAGYTDWTVDALKKPGFTMEFACNPYTEKDFDEIYKPAKALGLLFAQEALNLDLLYNTEVYVDGTLIEIFENEEDAKNFIVSYVPEYSNIDIMENEIILFTNNTFPLENVLSIANDFTTSLYNYDYKESNINWKKTMDKYISEEGFYLNNNIITIDELINERQEKELISSGVFISDINLISIDINKTFHVKGTVNYSYTTIDNKEDTLSKPIILSIYIDKNFKPQIISIIEEDTILNSQEITETNNYNN